jgi:membrane-bound lytic murein transglycosylase D
MHLKFDRWDLALAAYNCGEGCVQRAIETNHKRGLSTHFDALPLPLETRHYVPKLIALRNLVRDAKRYGIALAPIANEPYFMQVKLSQPMTPATIAKLAEVDATEFGRLNSGYRKSVIHTDAPRPLLPSDSVATFYSNMQRIESGTGPLRIYRADKGESLGKIAGQFGISIDWLKRHNVLNTQRGKLQQPQTVLIPTPQPASKGHQARKETALTSI